MARAVGVIVMQILIVFLIKAVAGGEGRRSEADTDRTACCCPRQEFSHPILSWGSGALGDLVVFFFFKECLNLQHRSFLLS